MVLKYKFIYNSFLNDKSWNDKTMYIDILESLCLTFFFSHFKKFSFFIFYQFKANYNILD